MNKYQGALNKIVKSCCPNCSTNGCKDCSIEKNCNATAKQWVDTLQELVDKAKSLTVNYIADGYADGFPVYDTATCPNCGIEFEVDYERHYRYCHHCGQKLNWENEDE